MRVSTPLATSLLQWFDVLAWISATAQVGTCVAFDAGLCDAWDDLHWDAEHDRKTLSVRIDEWGIDAAMPSVERHDLARHYALLRCSSDDDTLPSRESQEQVVLALSWRETRGFDAWPWLARPC